LDEHSGVNTYQFFYLHPYSFTFHHSKAMPQLSAVTMRAARRAEDMLAKSDGPTNPEDAVRSHHFECSSCVRTLNSEAGRSQHIAKTPACTVAQEAASRKMHCMPSGSAGSQIDRQGAHAHEQTPVALEPPVHPHPTSQLQTPDPTPVNTSLPNDTTSEPSCPTIERSSDKRGPFVERYPCEKAGKPIKPDIAYVPDQHEYMRACGNLANPEWFSISELLMTTGMTKQARDTHLKHPVVSLLFLSS
jgi:hypothetical protein